MVDARTGQIVRQWTGPGGDSLRFGFGAIWLSNYREKTIWRVPLRATE